jgi:DNA-binding CsgD family transcriptional regulator
MSRQEIADQLDISSNTVRTHMQSILSKLGVHSSLAAVAMARRAGLS